LCIRTPHQVSVKKQQKYSKVKVGFILRVMRKLHLKIKYILKLQNLPNVSSLKVVLVQQLQHSQPHLGQGGGLVRKEIHYEVAETLTIINSKTQTSLLHHFV